jgi:hypothetical protein
VRPDVDLKHFRYFLAVAEEGTFTGAATATSPDVARFVRHATEQAIETKA